MKSGFDSETSVLVRGIGFKPVTDVNKDDRIAVLLDREWTWRQPTNKTSFESDKIARIKGGSSDLLCSPTQPLLLYASPDCWRVPANEQNMAEVIHGCDWIGTDTDSFRVGANELYAGPFSTIIAAFLSGGEVEDDGVTIIDADEPTMEAIRYLDLPHEVIGSYVDIKMPSTLRCFFSLLDVDGERRIITKLKRLKPEFLRLLWRPFENKVIKQKRFKGDLVEIVIKSGYTPKFVNNRLFTENRMSSTCEIDIIEQPTTLTNIDVKSGAILVGRNGKFTWVYTR